MSPLGQTHKYILTKLLEVTVIIENTQVLTNTIFIFYIP
jgi:hypothetical protein